jgi:ribose 5-phosphate isomerase B
MDEGLITRIVAEVVRRLRALEGERPKLEDEPAVRLVTEDLVAATSRRGLDAIRVVPGAVVTPLARDLLRQEKIRLVQVDEEVNDGQVHSIETVPVIALGADHRGFALKEAIGKSLQDAGKTVQDCGVHGTQAVSYIEVAEKVAIAVVSENLATGIMIDGGGTHAAVVANKVVGIRAVACHDVTSARYARAHIDANLLCLGVGVVGDTVAEEIVATWLTTPFEGGRYQKRVRELEDVERRHGGK